MLVRSNQFPRQTCARSLCPWVAQGEDCRERCFREGVTYSARCRRCRSKQISEGVAEEEIIDKVYIGESHRSLVTRCREHFAIYKAGRREEVVRREEEDDGFQKAGSWMREHTLKCHGGVFSEDKQKDYEFFLLNCHSKVLRR